MAFKPTKQQESAINENGSILVTAAAGSGKTAVLVERVIRKLKDRENPTSIDRLLIVTFTNAAAAEMRLRIENRINEELEKASGDAHLFNQSLLLPSAQISTIDSFCINLVRENFEQFDIEPDFKIVEEGELGLIYEKALTETLDWFYDNEAARITGLFSALQSVYGDSTVTELVLNLFKYSRNLPFPNRWLTRCKETYLQQPREYVRLCSDIVGFDGLKKFESARELLKQAVEHCPEDDKLQSVFGEALSKLYNDFEELFALVKSDAKASMKACRGFAAPYLSLRGKSEAQVLARAVLKAVNEAVGEFAENAGGNEAVLLDEIEFSAPHIATLIDITVRFGDVLAEYMKKENVLTFYNTEQMCLSLLCDERDGELVMSEKAVELSQNFDEILVDEYQDTNDLQDTLFYMLSDNGKKLFSVGDVKQSIYGFRGANPENFVNKKESYTLLENAAADESKKIILSSNFRSRAGICSFVNHFCSLVMSKALGGVEYNEEEILNSEAEFPECELPETEVHFLTADEENAEITEARHIAAYIKNTVHKEKFLRDEDGLRAAKYSDFCILLRSPGNHSDVYMKELEKLGIPARIETKGFLNSREISAALSLLKVIDNPSRDIPLLALLMSPVFGFSADDVAEIRLCSRDTSLYTALLAAEKDGNERAKTVLEKLRIYRRAAVTKNIPELLMWLYDETGLLNSVSALDDGERRRTNLLTLCRLSENYVNAGISAFVNYIEKTGEEIKTPAGASGNNAVSIVSFHHSKGLQYPVCIVAGCFRKFYKNDLWKPLLRDRKLGVSLKLASEAENRVIESVAYKAIQKANEDALLSEELRAMYVALTRAEERLVVVMSAAKNSGAPSKVASLINSGDDALVLRKSVGYYDWFLYSLFRLKNCEELRKIFDASISEEKLVDNDLRVKLVFGAETSEGDDSEQTVSEVNSEEITELKKRFDYRYPYDDLTAIYAKTSVSEIVAADKSAGEFKGRPAFASRAGLTPAERGIATHKFMQYADYFLASKGISKEIERLKEDAFITAEEAAAIDVAALEKFFQSELYSRMAEALELHREMRFLSEMPASELFSVETEEKTVVQGIIDCVIEEEDGVVVVDFKTDAVKTAEELSERYKKQLDIYSAACEKIFGKRVLEKYIYSFALGSVIKL